MTKKNFALGLCCALLFSCKKNTDVVMPQKVIDPSKVGKLPTTEAEKKLVKNLEKVTDVFKEIYKNKSNIALVNAAITTKTYHDEGVLLKDLIFPAQSRVKNFPKFIQKVGLLNYSLDNFANSFWTEVSRKNDAELTTFLNTLSNNNYRSNNNGTPEVSVYFPYADNFIDPNGGATTYGTVTSLVTATADADEGWGSLPTYLNGVLQGYTQVLVNDDYVCANPTHIIGVVGLEQTDPVDIVDSVPPPPPPLGVSRLYIGHLRCTPVQYDKLISFTGNGGGSEIKVGHMTGYLQPVNGHVTSFQDIVSKDFHRAAIRFGVWIRLYTVWDDDWQLADGEQFLGIYEEDNTNDKTFTGTLSTTLRVDSTLTSTGNIGFTVAIKSQDDIIRQLKISRNSYFTGAFQDQGWGRKNDYTFLPLPHILGWPKYDGGANVSWTWPYQVL